MRSRPHSSLNASSPDRHRSSNTNGNNNNNIHPSRHQYNNGDTATSNNSLNPVSPSGPRVEHSRNRSSSNNNNNNNNNNSTTKRVSVQMGGLPLDTTDCRTITTTTTTTTTNRINNANNYSYSAALDGTGDLRPLPGRARRKRGKFQRTSSSERQSFAKRCYARWFKGFASFFLGSGALIVAVALWYLLGVVSIATSKLLLTHYTAAVPPLVLTVQQLLIGTTLLRFLLHTHFLSSPGLQPAIASTNRHVSRRWSYVSPPPTTNSQFNPLSFTRLGIHPKLGAAGLFFTFGFYTTNMAFGGAAASFVETIKAAEPLTSAVVAWLWQIEILGQAECVSLGAIVAGVAFSTLGGSAAPAVSSTTTTTPTSLTASLQTSCIVLVANLCFSFRGLYQKLLSADGIQLDDLNLQFRMQQVGVAVLMVPALVWEGPAVVQYWWHHGLGRHFLRFVVLSIVNGLCFTGYNLASTFILTRISVVHHAALNCLRRVFAIICTSLYFQNPLTLLGMCGIGLSTAGFLSFTHYKVQRQRQPKPLSSLLPVSVSSISSG